MLERLTALFLALLNMSLTASWVILAVFAVRILLQKAPRRVTYWLWMAVLFRLLCPFSPQSILSLIPSAQPIPADILCAETPRIESGIPALDTAVNPILPAGTPAASTNPLQLWATAGALVWALGALLLAAYSAVTVAKLIAALKKAQPSGPENNRTRILPGLRSPFVFGLPHPVVYLPEGLSPEKTAFILAHETAHLRRGDPYVKPLAWAAVCLHWFNPLVWAAFFAFEKDMELSCDEIVVGRYTAEQRRQYSETLLALASARRFVGGCPLAFGESNVKSRIKHVLYTKKAVVWAAAAAAVLVGVLCAALALNPRTNTAPESAPAGSAVRAESAAAAPADESAAPAQAGTSGAALSDRTETLTKENTAAFIRAALESLTLHTDNTVTFQLPGAIPTDPAGATKLTISMYLRYQDEQGDSDVQNLLDWATDWRGGQRFTGGIEPARGELSEVMLRVAFMTLTEQTTSGATYEEYDADYVLLTAPFSYEQGQTVTAPDAEVSTQTGKTGVQYLLQNGGRLTVSCALPAGMTLAAYVPESKIPDDGDSAYRESELPAVYLLQDGEVVGTLALSGYAATAQADLAGVDTAADSLPMAVYATAAMTNHADYSEHYRVVSHTARASNAVTKYLWQNLDAPGYDAAAEIPFQSKDCVMAFNLDTAPYFAVFRLREGVLTEAQLTDFARSVSLA
jgi:beta-lactamase regulating signal transducer with metallopeptidase domain